MSTLWLIFCKEKELWILSSVHVESSAGRVVLPRLQASIQHCENPPIFYLKITFGQKKPNTSSSPNAKGFLVIQHEVYWNSGGFLWGFFFHISGARFIFQRFASTWLSGCRFLKILFEERVVAVGGKWEKVGEWSATRESEQTVKISLPFQITAVPMEIKLYPIIQARCIIRFLTFWVGVSCYQVGRKTSSCTLCHVCDIKET